MSKYLNFQLIAYVSIYKNASKTQGIKSKYQVELLTFFLLRYTFFSKTNFKNNPQVKIKHRRGVVVITTTQLHSTKPELRFCAGSNPAHGVSEIRDGEDL